MVWNCLGCQPILELCEIRKSHRWHISTFALLSVLSSRDSTEQILSSLFWVLFYLSLSNLCILTCVYICISIIVMCIFRCIVIKMNEDFFQKEYT